MNNKTEKRLLITVIVTFIIMVALGIWLLYNLYFPRFSTPFPSKDFIEMPQLIGMDYSEIVEEWGSILNFHVSYEYSSEHEKGQVFFQSVLASRLVREGQRIDIFVSLGAPEENGENE